MQNLHDDGHAWKKNNITKEQVFALNARIGVGSSQLWQVVKARLEEAVERGILR